MDIHKEKTRLSCWKGGFVIPPALLLPSLKTHEGGYELDLFLTTDIQKYAMSPIRLAMCKEFKTMVRK